MTSELIAELREYFRIRRMNVFAIGTDLSVRVEHGGRDYRVIVRAGGNYVSLMLIGIQMSVEEHGAFTDAKGSELYGICFSVDDDNVRFVYRQATSVPIDHLAFDELFVLIEHDIGVLHSYLKIVPVPTILTEQNWHEASPIQH